jgi:MftR C-terminal domain
MVAAALEAAVPVFYERRKIVRQRQAVVTANSGLQERELLKLASLASAMTEALHRRGVPEPTASLVAEVGMIAFHTAYARWITAPEEHDLAQLIRGALD